MWMGRHCLDSEHPEESMNICWVHWSRVTWIVDHVLSHEWFAQAEVTGSSPTVKLWGRILSFQPWRSNTGKLHKWESNFWETLNWEETRIPMKHIVLLQWVLITPLPISTLELLLSQKILWCLSCVVICIYRFRMGAVLGWSECWSSHCWLLDRKGYGLWGPQLAGVGRGGS